MILSEDLFSDCSAIIYTAAHDVNVFDYLPVTNQTSVSKHLKLHITGYLFFVLEHHIKAFQDLSTFSPPFSQRWRLRPHILLTLSPRLQRSQSPSLLLLLKCPTSSFWATKHPFTGTNGPPGLVASQLLVCSAMIPVPPTKQNQLCPARASASKNGYNFCGIGMTTSSS